MILENFVEVLFLIRNILKVIRNFDPESRNSIPVSIIDIYQIQNEINYDISLGQIMLISNIQNTSISV